LGFKSKSHVQFDKNIISTNFNVCWINDHTLAQIDCLVPMVLSYKNFCWCYFQCKIWDLSNHSGSSTFDYLQWNKCCETFPKIKFKNDAGFNLQAPEDQSCLVPRSTLHSVFQFLNWKLNYCSDSFNNLDLYFVSSNDFSRYAEFKVSCDNLPFAMVSW